MHYAVITKLIYIIYFYLLKNDMADKMHKQVQSLDVQGYGSTYYRQIFLPLQEIN